jgi:outer membrane protein assembly factor BamB
MRALRLLAAIAIPPVAIFGALYLFAGLRIELSGGGMPNLVFRVDHAEQAELIAKHRAAQRAAMPPPPALVTARAPAPAPVASATSARSDTPATPATVAPAVAPLTGKLPYWTDFRGPRRDAQYRERPLLVSWPAGGLKPLWKQPAGAGYASFAAAHGRAFTIEQRGREEVVAAYDVATGRELWTHGWPAQFRESMGGDGPRATPTWSDGHVFALGATGELRSLAEATGRLVWRTNILDDNGARNLIWGMAGAPLIVGDAVIVAPGGLNGHSVAAYDRRRGTRLWSSQNEKAGYSSPMLVTLAGREQILLFTGVGLLSVTPDRGERLWFHPWHTNADINAAQPVVIGENRVFISSGYDVGGAVLEIAPDGTGYAVREVWRNNRMKNRFAGSVLHDGFLYGLDESIMACVDAATGELKWKGGRYGYGQLILAGDRIIVLTERGDLVLLAANHDRHEELASFSAVDGKTWNMPAIVDGVLLVRNLREMAAFDLRHDAP